MDEEEIEEFDDLELNNSNILYVLSIIIKGKDKKVLEDREVASCQYEKEILSYYESLKNSIGQVKESFSHLGEITEISFTLNMTIDDEIIEEVATDIFTF